MERILWIPVIAVHFLCVDSCFAGFVRGFNIDAKSDEFEIVAEKESQQVKQEEDSPKDFFHSARPIWPEGLEKEKNLFVGFRAVFETSSCARAVLRVAASTLYRAWLNGKFLCHGPARGPHGFYRVDEWDMSNDLVNGKNLIVIEAAGYNVNSYYILDQPSFLQAEVVSVQPVTASTAAEETQFQAQILEHNIKKT